MEDELFSDGPQTRLLTQASKFQSYSTVYNCGTFAFETGVVRAVLSRVGAVFCFVFGIFSYFCDYAMGMTLDIVFIRFLR
jgi:uncharacterized membrane protein